MDEESDITDPIIKATKKHKHHPSILLINSKLSCPESFCFNKINNSDMEKEIKLLSIKKVTTLKNIPPKVLKSSAHTCSKTLTKLFNDTMNNSQFPDELKLVFDKINYHPLLAKLHAYGFTNKSMRLIKSYLTNRW